MAAALQVIDPRPGRGFYEPCVEGSKCKFSHDIKAFTRAELEQKLTTCKNVFWSKPGPTKDALMRAFKALK